MQPVLSRAQVRTFDRLATERANVPSLLLMENAGRGAADRIVSEFPSGALGSLRVVVVAGGGNNGGDGFVVARRLLVLGISVEVFCLHEEAELRADALSNYRALVGAGGSVRSLAAGQLTLLDVALGGADVVVDALLGTGLSRPVTGLESDLILRINRARGLRVSLDIPSGLDADTGEVLGVAVRASHTITFAAHKPGFFSSAGLLHSGRIHVADIGIPLSSLPDVGTMANRVEPADVARALPLRPLDVNKVSAGRVLVLAGSPGKIGAALLVARGALRAGAGLVTLAGLPETRSAFDASVLEAMSAELDPARIEESLEPLLSNANAVVIGPGFGFSDFAQSIVERVVLGHSGVVVVDADAISHFRGAAARLATTKGQLMLTPHAGELARLLSITSAEVEADRFSALRRAVDATQAIVLLKGPHSLVGAPSRLPVIVSEGSKVLATGGTGDVLSGIVAALACQTDAFEAAYSGAFLHGRAARSWQGEFGADAGLLAHEVADRIPRARAELAEAQ
jgi:NAD(P)H-hydrate epimerase